MKAETIDYLDQQTKLARAPKAVECPVPGTGRERWMYCTGYLAGYLAALNAARTAIAQAVAADTE